MTTIHVSGWKTCHYFQKAINTVIAMELLYPNKIKADIQTFPDIESYIKWLRNVIDNKVIQFKYDNESKLISHTSSPFVYINENQYIGGCDDILNYIRLTVLPKEIMNNHINHININENINHSFYSNDLNDHNNNYNYDYDLIVIGGGSGGLALSKAAAKLNKKVCVIDYVKPSPKGSTWGLGGTCVNVGCIPKKLMHQASLIGEMIHKDSFLYGWHNNLINDKNGLNEKNLNMLKPKNYWNKLVTSVQNNIMSTNFKYRVELREKSVVYENYLASFIDKHTVLCVNNKKKPDKREIKLTARRFVIAVGGRPRPLMCKGGHHAITSDDIFQLRNADNSNKLPAKTLVIGASYVALECAGFLSGLGFDTTIMVRSILLRGFDQEMANKIGDYMEMECDIKFIKKAIPYEIIQMPNSQYKVIYIKQSSSGKEEKFEDIFDTILNATGRDADIQGLNLEALGIQINKENKKLITINEQTSVPNIYAIGDIVDGAPELTPVAILAGKLLANRLYNGSHKTMDYKLVCTTVFTSIEYSCVGLTEEEARNIYETNHILVYHQYFTPLEWAISQDRMHYLGPNAGEVMQGYGVAMKKGLTYEDLISTVGIHPTTSELFTMLTITKESGEDPAPKGCCG